MVAAMVCSSVQLCRPSTSRSTGQSKYSGGVALAAAFDDDEDDVSVATGVFVVGTLASFCNQFII